MKNGFCLTERGEIFPADHKEEGGKWRNGEK